MFAHSHIIQKSHSDVCCVCSNLCTVLRVFIHSCVHWVYVCDFYICPHASVYEYYFALFLFVTPCVSTLTFNYCFFLPVGFFIIVILDPEVQRERENNLAILRETFLLPSFGNDVMSENLQKTRQIFYPKIHLLKYWCSLT